jgi:hypothetical protein
VFGFGRGVSRTQIPLFVYELAPRLARLSRLPYGRSETSYEALREQRFWHAWDAYRCRPQTRSPQSQAQVRPGNERYCSWGMTEGAS